MAQGACLALNASKWYECVREICTFHELPFPTDDERLPVGMGSNPVRELSVMGHGLLLIYIFCGFSGVI